MTEDQYRAQYHEDDAVGWDAINAALETLYGDREPRHYGSIVKYAIGGKDPLDGTSIYDCDEQTYHRHLISYGMSELYFDPESADAEYSGWGFEFTMRIAPCAEDQTRNGAEHDPVWVINLMNNLARYVFDSENWFEPYHFITANGPIRADPKLPAINTPNGEVQFLQLVGLTQSELDWLWQDPTRTRCRELIDKMRADNPLLITDLHRSKSHV